MSRLQIKITTVEGMRGDNIRNQFGSTSTNLATADVQTARTEGSPSKSNNLSSKGNQQRNRGGKRQWRLHSSPIPMMVLVNFQTIFIKTATALYKSCSTSSQRKDLLHLYSTRKEDVCVTSKRTGSVVPLLKVQPIPLDQRSIHSEVLSSS